MLWPSVTDGRIDLDMVAEGTVYWGVDNPPSYVCDGFDFSLSSPAMGPWAVSNLAGKAHHRVKRVHQSSDIILSGHPPARLK